MTFKLRQWMLKLFFEVPDYKIARRQRGRKAAHDLLDITLVNEVRCRNFWLRCAFPMFWMTNVLLESTDDLKRKIQKSSFFAGWLGNDVWFVFPQCLSLAFLSARWKEVKETISLSPIRWPGLHLMDGFGCCLKGAEGAIVSFLLGYLHWSKSWEVLFWHWLFVRDWWLMAWVEAVDVEMCFTHAISAGISSWQAECLDSSAGHVAAFVFFPWHSNGVDCRSLTQGRWIWTTGVRVIPISNAWRT